MTQDTIFGKFFERTNREFSYKSLFDFYHSSSEYYNYEAKKIYFYRINDRTYIYCVDGLFTLVCDRKEKSFEILIGDMSCLQQLERFRIITNENR